MDKIISDWLTAHLHWVYIGISIVGLVAALLVWLRLLRVLMARAGRNESDWDDIVLHSIKTPVSVFIILFGAQYIGESLISLLPQLDADQRAAKFFATSRSLVFVAMLFWMLFRFVSRLERKYRRERLKIADKSIDIGTLHTVFRFVRGAIILLSLLALMNVFGISISGFLAFGGIGGIILGFAAKDTLSNFFSGLMIFWERPFVIGDWIRCTGANVEGVVEHIGWRMTQIRTFDQRPLYIPNSLFFNNVIENPQRMTNRRIYEYCGVRYADIDALPQVLADIRAMLREHEGIDQQMIQMVNFDRYAVSSLDFFVYAMTETTDWAHFHRVKEDVLLKIAAIIKRHGCQFAFPTRTVHVASPPPSPPPPSHGDTHLSA